MNLAPSQESDTAAAGSAKLSRRSGGETIDIAREARGDRRPPDSHARSQERLLFAATAVLLAYTLLTGGAGVRHPLLAGAAEAGAVLLLVMTASLHRLRGPAINLPVLLLAALILLLPLVQLVPLPWSLWAQLPGRAIAARLLVLAGLAGESRPFSLDPEATLRSLLALLPAYAVFFALCRLPAERRLRLLWAIVAAAILSALLGGLQRATGADPLVTPFPSDNSAFGAGLFVNRNHQATFLLLAMPLATMLLRLRPPRGSEALGTLLAIGLVALFAGAIVATTSRTGIALLPVAVLAALALLGAGRLGRRQMLLALALVVVAGLVVLSSTGGQLVLARFAPDDARFGYWQDAKLGVAQFWPLGSGIGSFAAAFPGFENLNSVTEARVYNAHNDYLELAFEAGAAAALLAFLFLALFAVRTWRGLRRPGAARLVSAAAAAGVALVLHHSAVDYPLRMLSIEAAFACLLALLATGGMSAQARASAAPRRPGAPRLLGTLACAAAGLLALWAIASTSAADAALSAQDYAGALRLRPGTSEAADQVAFEALRRGDLASAESGARRALAAAPLDANAGSILALAAMRRGDVSAARSLLASVGLLGWRSGIGQLAIVRMAAVQNQPALEVLSADALLRQGIAEGPMIERLRAIAATPAGAALVADRLAESPPWRTRLLTDLGGAGPAVYPAQAQLLVALLGTGAPPQPDEVFALLSRMVQGGAAAQASGLWNALEPRLVPPGERSLAGQLLQPAPWSPFDWRKAGEVDVAPAADGPGVELGTDRSGTSLAIARLLTLAPGAYALVADLTPVGDGEPASAAWQIACPDGTAVALAPGSTAAKAAFAVPASGCAVQRLTLRIDQDTPATVRFRIADVRITPSRPR
jgi:O-antigen ligase